MLHEPHIYIWPPLLLALLYAAAFIGSIVEIELADSEAEQAQTTRRSAPVTHKLDGQPQMQEHVQPNCAPVTHARRACTGAERQAAYRARHGDAQRARHREYMRAWRAARRSEALAVAA
jgi:hypothetical protein